MKKILGISLVVATTFFMTGCGGSGGSGDNSVSRDAADILIGKTLYYVDDYLDDPAGYYSDSFEKDKMTDKEYDKDKNLLYTDVVSIKYEGETIVFTDGNDESSCHVERMKESITFDCKWNGGSDTTILWDTIDLAKANPDK